VTVENNGNYYESTYECNIIIYCYVKSNSMEIVVAVAAVLQHAFMA